MLKGEVERGRGDLNPRSSDRQSDALNQTTPRPPKFCAAKFYPELPSELLSRQRGKKLLNKIYPEALSILTS